MNKVKEIKIRIQQVEMLLANLRIDLTKAYSETFLKCKHCEQRTKIGKCVLVNYQWYDDNTGSPCGGFYQHGGYHIGCPKCKHYWGNKIEDEKAYEMTGAFKAETKEFEKGTSHQYTLEEE